MSLSLRNWGAFAAPHFLCPYFSTKDYMVLYDTDFPFSRRGGFAVKPVSIRPPSLRNQGSWVAEISIKGVSYTLPVLHQHVFDHKGIYDDEMKSRDGNVYRGKKYEALKQALKDPRNNGWIIVQITDDDGEKRSANGYIGVFETTNLDFREFGFRLQRGRQIAMFSK